MPFFKFCSRNLLIMCARQCRFYSILLSCASVLLLLLITKEMSYKDDRTHPFAIPAWRLKPLIRKNISLESEQYYREAIVTVVTGDLYLPGALVLGYTLNKYNAIKSHRRDMIVLIKEDALPDKQHIKMLQEVGWIIIYIKTIPFPGEVKSRLADGIIKLRAWNMTQYTTIATLDADVMLIGSIEEPFQIMRTNPDLSLLAVNNPYLTHKEKLLSSYFNAGVLFLRPNSEDYKNLMHLSSQKGSYDLKQPQQNLLNTYFFGKWLGLPFIYNYGHRNPKWIIQRNNIRIVHFAGDNKPWNKINNTNEEKNKFELHETDHIWHRFFVNMVNEYKWQKHDFLGGNASETLRISFDFERLNNKPIGL